MDLIFLVISFLSIDLVGEIVGVVGFVKFVVDIIINIFLEKNDFLIVWCMFKGSVFELLRFFYFGIIFFNFF